MTTTTETTGSATSATPGSPLLDLAQRVTRTRDAAYPFAGDEDDQSNCDHRRRDDELAYATALAEDGRSDPREQHERHQRRPEHIGDALRHPLVLRANAGERTAEEKALAQVIAEWERPAMPHDHRR